MNHHQLHMTIAATSISDMPQEILERILDFLHDDHATLYSVSLVSRAWVHAPRYHLFRQTLLTEIYGRGRLLKEDARSFLVLAHSEHCTILPAIQYVIFVVATQELVDDLVEILAPLKRLSQLTYIHTLRSETISWNAQILSNIHDFSFDFLWYNFDADARRLVTSFPNLHSLALYTDATCPITLPSSIPGYVFRNLRTLRLRLVASEELFEWLKKLDGTCFILETLDLRMFRPDRGTSWGSMSALNSFLKEVSDTLKHLSIGISYDAGLNELSESRDLETQIDLGPLVNLHSLFLRTWNMPTVCSSLISLNPYSMLEKLTIHALPWGPQKHSKTEPCKYLFSMFLPVFARIIAGEQFVGIKLLDLHIPEGLDLGIVEKELAQWDRKGILKGILTVSYTKDEDVQYNTLDAIRPLIWRQAE
ncbi:hypothetical protein BJ912DRAFT_1043814 [Pholiota molesta]|nr:hypothetical protein BJ912DRAFT_1043814 [Pholiota molesta]